MLFSRSKSSVALPEATPAPGTALVQLRNIEKAYQHGVSKTFVLRRVDVDIKEGEFVSIMGPSGAGKSTLLHIIGMHDSAWTGEYWFLGASGARDGQEAARRAAQAVHGLRVPELSPAGPPDRVRESRRAAVLPQRQASRSAIRSCATSSTASRSSGRRTSIRTSCRAASSSWWRWPARSSRTRR